MLFTELLLSNVSTCYNTNSCSLVSIMYRFIHMTTNPVEFRIMSWGLSVTFSIFCNYQHVGDIVSVCTKWFQKQNSYSSYLEYDWSRRTQRVHKRKFWGMSLGRTWVVPGKANLMCNSKNLGRVCTKRIWYMKVLEQKRVMPSESILCMTWLGRTWIVPEENLNITVWGENGSCL